MDFSQVLAMVSGNWNCCMKFADLKPMSWKHGLIPEAEVNHLLLLQIRRHFLTRRHSSQKRLRIFILGVTFLLFLHLTISAINWFPSWCCASMCITTVRQRCNQGLWSERQLIFRTHIEILLQTIWPCSSSKARFYFQQFPWKNSFHSWRSHWN